MSIYWEVRSNRLEGIFPTCTDAMNYANYLNETFGESCTVSKQERDDETKREIHLNRKDA